MPRKVKQAVEPQQVDEEQADAGHEPVALTKADYLKAKQTIKQFREEKKAKPKRPCSQRQLEALAAGRMKNQRFAKSQVKPSD